jgi:GNAT superfamily N-acetyltransferase
MEKMRMNAVFRFLRKPPLQMLKAICDLLPGHPFDVQVYYALQTVGIPTNLPDRFSVTIREGNRDDLPAFLRCMDKGERFLSRLGAGDRCLLAFNGNQVVGFLWFSVRETYTEEMTCYSFPVPANAVYSYDEYVSPEYRQQGILSQLFAVLHDWMRRCGRDTIIIMIAHDNDISWKAHLKRGFVAFRKILFVRILCWRSFRETVFTGR